MTLWTVAHQAPLSMGISRQEYRSGLPLPPTGDLPNPGIKPASPGAPALQADFLTTEPRGKPLVLFCYKLVTKGMLPISLNYAYWPFSGTPASQGMRIKLKYL